MSYPQSKFLREKREKKERILKAKSLKFHLKNQIKSYSKTKIRFIVNF